MRIREPLHPPPHCPPKRLFALNKTHPPHPSHPTTHPPTHKKKRVRLYDTHDGPGRWRLRKDVTTRMTRWTITDTAQSPDGRFLVYWCVVCDDLVDGTVVVCCLD